MQRTIARMISRSLVGFETTRDNTVCLDTTVDCTAVYCYISYCVQHCTALWILLWTLLQTVLWTLSWIAVLITTLAVLVCTEPWSFMCTADCLFCEVSLKLYCRLHYPPYRVGQCRLHLWQHCILECSCLLGGTADCLVDFRVDCNADCSTVSCRVDCVLNFPSILIYPASSVWWGHRDCKKLLRGVKTGQGTLQEGGKNLEKSFNLAFAKKRKGGTNVRCWVFLKYWLPVRQLLASLKYLPSSLFQVLIWGVGWYSSSVVQCFSGTVVRWYGGWLWLLKGRQSYWPYSSTSYTSRVSY